MTYLSVNEAAEIAQKNERTIRRWIKANKIKSSKIRGRLHVDEDSLYEVIEKKGKRKKEKGGNNKTQNSKLKTTTQNHNSKPINYERQSKFVKQETPKGSQGKKMSGQTINTQEKDVRTTAFVSDKMRKYINMLETQNAKLKSLALSATRHKQERDAEKMQKKQVDTITDTNIIREGEEYVLNGGENGQKMSGHGEFNMSVNKLSDTPITSQVLPNNDVEMSVLTESDVSGSLLSFLDRYFDSTPDDVMSDFSGHLSTKLDIPVDNYFDRRGMIDAENPFSGDTKNMSGQNVGHINRTVELSAYASRLIDEKERVAIKFEEQNDFLKNELSELRKEVSALRGVVAGESNNRTNTSEFLMRMNESLQKRVEELDKSQYKFQNLELKTQNYNSKLENPQDDDRDSDIGHQYNPVKRKIVVSGQDRQDNDSVNAKIDNCGHTKDHVSRDTDNLQLERMEKNIIDALQIEIFNKEYSDNMSDADEDRKLFLVGVGAGMILGLVCVSMVLWVLI